MKRLAIFLDGSSSDHGALRVATRIAGLADAHLDVLYPWQADQLRFALPGAAAALTHDLVGPGGQNAARNAYDSLCLGRPNVRWVNVAGAMDDAIRAFGLHYDSIFVKRLAEERGPQARAFNTALFQTGAMVVVTPPAMSQAEGAGAVAVVWSGTPQSSRAMRAAMPLLKAAGAVHLMTNAGQYEAVPDQALEYLAVHGVAASHLPFDGRGLTARGRGRAIIEATRSVGADYLVMGGFGEHHMDALFGLGRTTRKLVTAAPVPLLLHS
jgi:nucleotide-binding universal stress UspA family protein